MFRKIRNLVSGLLLLLFCVGLIYAQTTSFNYQGRLTDGATPANGNYDLQFALFDSASGGTQIGTTQTVPTVTVSGGIFSVTLDFGAGIFPGANRWLEISARLSGAAAFTTLSPRQQITSAPYAIRSLNASSADTVTVNGVPSGSGNYIQNTSTPKQIQHSTSMAMEPLAARSQQTSSTSRRSTTSVAAAYLVPQARTICLQVKAPANQIRAVQITPSSDSTLVRPTPAINCLDLTTRFLVPRPAKQAPQSAMPSLAARLASGPRRAPITPYSEDLLA